jgi:hypothetical protein
MGRGQGTIVVALDDARVRRGGRRKWTIERVQRELELFLDDRGAWPTVAEFREAGRTDLYDAVLRYGAPNAGRRG